MELYSEYVSWVSYTKAQLVLAEIDEERELSALEGMSAVKLLDQYDPSVKGELATVMKARRDSDPEILAQKDKHREFRMYRKLVETVFDKCERNANLLSRELSRRIGMSNTTSKHNRYMP